MTPRFYQIQFIPRCLLAATLPTEINTHERTNGHNTRKNVKSCQMKNLQEKNLFLRAHFIDSN